MDRAVERSRTSIPIDDPQIKRGNAISIAHSYLRSGPRLEVSLEAWDRRLTAYIAWLIYLIAQAVTDLSRSKEGSTEEGISPVLDQSINRLPMQPRSNVAA
ncbi:hypothetical protein BJX65DRAFT_219404 [Aspergillus insuetus]